MAKEKSAKSSSSYRKPPFIDLLGLTFERLDSGEILVKLPMRDELIGNLETGAIHGGAISAMLDVTGGLAVIQKLRKDMKEQSLEDQIKRFSKVKTIDMRVDYLRPPKGNEFIGTASILRRGNKVAVTRMELHNEEGELIAVGTGTYSVG
jgi:uncharacterized protein (TIGR00369 family)